jgi:hypothetical protein
MSINKQEGNGSEVHQEKAGNEHNGGEKGRGGCDLKSGNGGDGQWRSSLNWSRCSMANGEKLVWLVGLVVQDSQVGWPVVGKSSHEGEPCGHEPCEAGR